MQIHYTMKMNELDDFIGKWRRLKQAEKKADLVLNTLAGNAWVSLCPHRTWVTWSAYQTAESMRCLKWSSTEKTL